MKCYDSDYITYCCFYFYCCFRVLFLLLMQHEPGPEFTILFPFMCNMFWNDIKHPYHYPDPVVCYSVAKVISNYSTFNKRSNRNNFCLSFWCKLVDTCFRNPKEILNLCNRSPQISWMQWNKQQWKEPIQLHYQMKCYCQTISA